MNKFSGTGVALITPFNNDMSIDFNSLEKLVEFVIHGGVDFLVVLGTTGETTSLNDKEQNDVINCIKKTNNSRLPMILGIGASDPKSTAIGIGMWLGIIMAYNVWFIIWPNQKKALGIVECDPDEKAKSAKTAMLISRTNTLLSFPMLLSMVAAQNLY